MPYSVAHHFFHGNILQFHYVDCCGFRTFTVGYLFVPSSVCWNRSSIKINWKKPTDDDGALLLTLIKPPSENRRSLFATNLLLNHKKREHFHYFHHYFYSLFTNKSLLSSKLLSLTFSLINFSKTSTISLSERNIREALGSLPTNLKIIQLFFQHNCNSSTTS